MHEQSSTFIEHYLERKEKGKKEKEMKSVYRYTECVGANHIG